MPSKEQIPVLTKGDFKAFCEKCSRDEATVPRSLSAEDIIAASDQHWLPCADGRAINLITGCLREAHGSLSGPEVL